MAVTAGGDMDVYGFLSPGRVRVTGGQLEYARTRKSERGRRQKGQRPTGVRERWSVKGTSHQSELAQKAPVGARSCFVTPSGD